MITFISCCVLLVIGYFVYGTIAEKVFGIDNKLTPAYSKEDDVDYIPMPL